MLESLSCSSSLSPNPLSSSEASAMPSQSDKMSNIVTQGIVFVADVFPIVGLGGTCWTLQRHLFKASGKLLSRPLILVSLVARLTFNGWLAIVVAPNVQLNEGCGTQCFGSPEITPFHKAYSMSSSKVMVGQCCCHLLLASASTKFGTPLRFFRIPLQRRMQSL